MKNKESDENNDIRGLLARTDRGVFFKKSSRDPAQVLAESSYYKVNLERSEESGA